MSDTQKVLSGLLRVNVTGMAPIIRDGQIVGYSISADLSILGGTPFEVPVGAGVYNYDAQNRLVNWTYWSAEGGKITEGPGQIPSEGPVQNF